jgi:hypothetical protein
MLDCQIRCAHPGGREERPQADRSGWTEPLGITDVRSGGGNGGSGQSGDLEKKQRGWRMESRAL